MESTPKKAPRSKFPALLVVALALVALVFVIWRVDSAPSTMTLTRQQIPLMWYRKSAAAL